MEFATPAQRPVLLAPPLRPVPPANQTLPGKIIHVFVKAFSLLPIHAHSVAQEPTTFPHPAPAKSAPLKLQTVLLATLNLAFARCAH